MRRIARSRTSTRASRFPMLVGMFLSVLTLTGSSGRTSTTLTCDDPASVGICRDWAGARGSGGPIFLGILERSVCLHKGGTLSGARRASLPLLTRVQAVDLEHPWASPICW